eukprot:Awhi_evm1s10975
MPTSSISKDDIPEMDMRTNTIDLALNNGSYSKGKHKNNSEREKKISEDFKTIGVVDDENGDIYSDLDSDDQNNDTMLVLSEDETDDPGNVADDYGSKSASSKEYLQQQQQQQQQHRYIDIQLPLDLESLTHNTPEISDFFWDASSTRFV